MRGCRCAHTTFVVDLSVLTAERAAGLPLQDRLVTACQKGDVVEVGAALTEGASVNDDGSSKDGYRHLPLRAAAMQRHRAVVALLLSAGADPNAGNALHLSVKSDPPDILQLLVDAGADVNYDGRFGRAIFSAVDGYASEGCLAVLLAQPSLDLFVTHAHYHTTPAQYARAMCRSRPCAMVEQEVPSVCGCVCVSVCLCARVYFTVRFVCRCSHPWQVEGRARWCGLRATCCRATST